MFEELLESVVVQVNLEAVHLVVSHDLYIIAQVVHRDEFPSAVYHESTDAVIGEVSYFTLREVESLLCHLEEGTGSPVHTHGFGSGEGDAVGYLDGITFLAQCLVFLQCEDNVAFLSFPFMEGRAVIEQFLAIVRYHLCDALQFGLVLGIDDACLLVEVECTVPAFPFLQFGDDERFRVGLCGCHLEQAAQQGCQ